MNQRGDKESVVLLNTWWAPAQSRRYSLNPRANSQPGLNSTSARMNFKNPPLGIEIKCCYRAWQPVSALLRKCYLKTHRPNVLRRKITRYLIELMTTPKTRTLTLSQNKQFLHEVEPKRDYLILETHNIHLIGNYLHHNKINDCG